jgi:hypothetical protein
MKDLCVETQLCSRGRVEVMLGLLRAAGYLAPAPEPADRRRRVLVPTERLLALHKQRFDLHFAAMECALPEAALARADEPGSGRVSPARSQHQPAKTSGRRRPSSRADAVSALTSSDALCARTIDLPRWPLPRIKSGVASAARGVDDPAFQTLLRLVGDGRLHAKLSAPYRLSEAFPDYSDARGFHDALLRVNPERLLWGTDWPHPQIAAEVMPDDGHLVDLFNAWTPDPRHRQLILVDTPARLFGR